MCTVTYVPLKDGACLTSNRDEKVAREKAIPPTEYFINNKKVIFPKDPKAGGTWFAYDEKNIIILLNGAEEKHITKNKYQKSRGLIVIDLITSETILDVWKTINLDGIEPFTIVYFNGEELYQLQWNELEKSTISLNPKKNYIWSSSTLYEKETRDERELWFHEYILKNQENISPESLLNFHQFTESDNKEFGLQINRNNSLKTISITQCVLVQNKILSKYIDLM
ncbi:NRDE family protein [Flavobacterium sp.]|uniref:NRDE family protein n=1 Tax=Flavobacterium sp. TaxID=239 RepID=UPI0040472365